MGFTGAQHTRAHASYEAMRAFGEAVHTEMNQAAGRLLHEEQRLTNTLSIAVNVYRVQR